MTKAQLYAKHNVPYYWLIDPDQQTLEAYELVVDHYDLVASARDAEVITPSLFPGLSIGSPIFGREPKRGTSFLTIE